MTVDLGQKEYAAGLSYVAFGRAKTVNNIAFVTAPSGTRFMPSVKPPQTLLDRKAHDAHQASLAAATFLRNEHLALPFGAVFDDTAI